MQFFDVPVIVWNNNKNIRCPRTPHVGQCIEIIFNYYIFLLLLLLVWLINYTIYIMNKNRRKVWTIQNRGSQRISVGPPCETYTQSMIISYHRVEYSSNPSNINILIFFFFLLWWLLFVIVIVTMDIYSWVGPLWVGSLSQGIAGDSIVEVYRRYWNGQVERTDHEINGWWRNYSRERLDI